MSDPDIAAEWAWISRRDHNSPVIDVSDGLDAAQLDHIMEFADRHSPVPRNPGDEPPWITIGPLRRSSPLMAVSVRDLPDGRDETGRPVWPVRLFLMHYEDLAWAGASCQGLWDAVSSIRLPIPNGSPVYPDVQPQQSSKLTTVVEQHGLEWMSTLAALVLENQVTLDSTIAMSRRERLAVLDAVLALLPYGFRAAISVSTKVDNTAQHSVDLGFGDFVAGQPYIHVSHRAPIPIPQTQEGRAYRDLLQGVFDHNVERIIKTLWEVREPHPYKSAEDAITTFPALGPRAFTSHNPKEEALAGQYLHLFTGEYPSNAQRTASLASSPELQSAIDGMIAAQADTDRFHNLVAHRERVLFTVSHSGSLTPGAWHPLFVHVHRDGIRDQVEARLAELADRFGPRSHRSAASANSMIPLGTEVELQPVIPDARSQPPRIPVTWREELEEAAFELQYAGAADPGTVHHGSVLAFADGLLIAQIPVSFQISADSGAPAQLQSVSASMIREVFGSYAREDATFVHRFRAIYETLGIHLFVDTLDINAGEPWERYLERQIDRSDLFQLFWSPASAASANVEHEWRHALTVAGKRQPGIFFLRPVYWEEPHPEPPPPLSSLHFRYFDRHHLGI